MKNKRPANRAARRAAARANARPVVGHLPGHPSHSLALGLSAAWCLAASGPAWANPEGPTVRSGSASVVSSGAETRITASHNAVLDWRAFNIRAGESTTFLQPSSTSVVWNRINDSLPSQINGRLNANGYVVLYNQNGFFFGPQSVINVGGLVVTTSAPQSPDGGMGGLWQYSGPPPLASIINYGEVRAASGGSVFLIAEKIENHGVLTAPDGTIGLYAGKEVLISERPDGRGISARARLPEGSVDNAGRLVADAGAISLSAQVVNQTGIIQANSVREVAGVIELVATEAVTLGAASVIRAEGGDGPDASGGGRVLIKSEGEFRDAVGSTVSVRGGVAGGNGGELEVSASKFSSLKSLLDGAAQSGWAAGGLTLDPTDIIITSGGEGTTNGGRVGAGDPPETLRLDVSAAFQGFARITLDATRDIAVGDAFAATGASPVTWNLNDSTGVSAPGSLLTLRAGRNIVFEQNSRIVAGTGWSVKMRAGMDFATADSVKAGLGGIYLNGGAASADGAKPSGSGSIETNDGSIDLMAGNELLIGAGFVRTVGGGSIAIATGTGDIDAGLKPDWYQFSRNGYAVSSLGLGGIGTAAGGDVSVHAGRDLLSFLPVIGAYGTGNVSLEAGRSIFGSFLVRDGAGRMEAGDVGSAASPVSFNLVKGSWNVTARNDLFVNEVRNPNAAFNGNKPGARFNGAPLAEPLRVSYYNDYDPAASVRLEGGRSVQLLGLNLPRQAGNRDMVPVYAPKLEISAGAGGVVLGNDVVLAPSALGDLKISTRDGGGLRSLGSGYFQMVLSDSADANYKSFALGHAAVPLQTAQTDPVTVAIAGDIENVFLRLARKAEIAVGGSTRNFGYEGQNLHPTDLTVINIAGDFDSRSKITVESTTVAPVLAVLDPAVSENPSLGARLSYNEETRELEFQDRMTAAERDFLLHPRIKSFDDFGNVVVDGSGNPIYSPAVLTSDSTAIQRLFERSQDIPSSGLAYAGLQLGGPGEFRIRARNLDLGITKGIRTGDLGLNNALASISPQGAKIDVGLSGDLSMVSSQIASFGGGAINLAAAGELNVGSQRQFTSDDTPKGIYTAAGGDVRAVAGGDVNVNGSRIASYNGGNVSVVSQNGNVDAGEGARGIFTVTTQQLNPSTGLVETRNDSFFGSGILALTRRDSDAHLGNISVQAEKGNITANSGGILQLAFNKVNNGGAKIDLAAGGNIEANLSGVLGVNVNLNAGGDIRGLLVANQNINISAEKSVSVTALASGGVKIDAGGAVSGTMIAGGGLNVSGDSISAALISSSGNTQTSGDSSGAKVGAFNNVAAPTATKTVEDAAQTVAETKKPALEDDEQKKKRPVLARTTGRVTVILPK